MRVLHLIDQATVDRQPARVALLADLIAQDASCEHRVWFIGGDAAGYGIDVPIARRMYPWFGLNVLEPARLWWNRRLIREFDVVHAWSGPLAAAARQVGGLPPIVDGFAEPVGVATERLVMDRAAVRAAWGVETDQFVVAAMTDDPAATDAMLAIRVMGLVGEAGLNATLLTCPQAAGLNTAQQIVAQLRKPYLMTVHPDAALPWRILAGCDAVVVPGDLARSPLTLAWAAVAGLPILEIHPRTLVMAPDWEAETTDPARTDAPVSKPRDSETVESKSDGEPEGESDAAPAAGLIRALPIRGLAVQLRRLIVEPAAHRAAGEAMRQWATDRFGFTDWLAHQVAQYRG